MHHMPAKIERQTRLADDGARCKGLLLWGHRTHLQTWQEPFLSSHHMDNIPQEPEASAGPCTRTSDDVGTTSVTADGKIDAEEDNNLCGDQGSAQPEKISESQSLPPNVDSKDSKLQEALKGYHATGDLAADTSVAIREQTAELSNQVSQLNSKLVGSYERISDLEDEVHEHKGTIMSLQAKNKALELESAQHEEALKGGILVERANVQAELQRLTQRVLDESAKRTKSEASLSSINKELDELSASLFDEANKMVAAEKLQRIKAERKQADIEEAMKHVQEAMKGIQLQLSDLSSSLEAAEKERDDFRNRWLSAMGVHEAAQTDLTQSAPVNALTFFDGDNVTTANTSTTSVQSLRTSNATPRTSFPYSASLPAIMPPRPSSESLPYCEWIAFIKHLRNSRTEVLSRPPPMPYGESYSQAAAVIGGHSQLRYHPSVPQLSTKALLADILPLSYHLNEPFLKRCVEEDSDPTLRLDIAPGLGFLSRRTMQTSIIEGDLVIEPVWGDATDHTKCALCGASLDRWNGSRSGPNQATSPATSATNAVRKMLGTSVWGFPALKSKKSAVSVTTLHSPSSSVASVQSSQGVSTGPSTPNVSGGAFPFPSSPSLSSNVVESPNIHTFRSADNSPNRYPVCPIYCLGRLRAVCSFWTYVRNVEKGLLLEEGFRFAGVQASGNQTSTHGGVSSSQSSLGLAYEGSRQSTVEEKCAKESQPSAGEQTHLSDTQTIKDLSLEPVPTDVEPTERLEFQPEADQAATLPAVSTDSQSPSGPQLSTANQVSGVSTPSVGGTSSPQAATSAPPLPKRSAARVAAAPTPGSPVLTAREPPLPSNQSAIRPRTPSAFSRQTVAQATISQLTLEKPTGYVSGNISSRGSLQAGSSAANGSVGPSGVQNFIGLTLGWEDRCWQEFSRLKEEMFWRRLGATGAGAITQSLT